MTKDEAFRLMYQGEFVGDMISSRHAEYVLNKIFDQRFNESEVCETSSEFIERIKNSYSSSYSDDVVHDLYDFFSQNVVIPKGQNRHPYADVLHEWVEGNGELQRIGRCGFLTDNLVSAKEMFDAKEYRIKPKEPVYVYQYAYKDQDGDACISSFMTEEEGNRLLEERTKAIKLEWTKKEKS